jgi:hypothetical protein
VSGHDLQDGKPRHAGLFQGLGHDVVRQPAQLEVKLKSGDALCRAGDLAIHVAEGVFPADDVGQQFVGADFVQVIVLGADADADARHRARQRHARIQQRQRVPPQTVAMEEEPLDSMISLVTRTA